MECNVSEVRDKTPKLAGRLQEHRNYILAAGAVAVILFVAFYGSGTPKPVKPAAPAGVPVPAPATPDQVKSFTQELQRETAALAQQEQRADVARSQAEQLVAAQAGRTPGSVPPPPQGAPAGSIPPQTYGVPAIPEKKHESNIAVTYRSGAIGTGLQAAGPSVSSADPLSQERDDLRNLIDAEKQAVAATLSTISPNPPVTVAPTMVAPSAQLPAPPAPPAAGLETRGAPQKTYKLFEGTLIETVLTNRLNGSFTGPVSVLVTTAVYSHDREHVLIPRGSRVIGEAQRVGQQGQQRLAVVFHKMIMPDGFEVSLDKFTGLDSVGETGLKDKTDNHWSQIFGTSVALGLVSGFSQFGTGSALTTNGIGQYRQGVASSVGQSSTQVLESRLNILPTITIREGHRVRVLLRQDIDIPAYDNHKVPADI